MSAQLDLLPGVPVDVVFDALTRAAGQELQSGKFTSPESSSALAVNCFGWFVPRPKLLPPFPGAPALSAVEVVALEYCARFPWAGGRHPWLDAMIQTPQLLVGVESKRFEPFRDKKVVALSKAYDRPVWGEGMEPFERMRDRLRQEPRLFRYLDAAQLVKHAFGLVTDAKRKSRRAHLHYLFAEPAQRAGKPISSRQLEQHREEAASFAADVVGADVTFSACSYRDWLANWRGAAVERHRKDLVGRFAP